MIDEYTGRLLKVTLNGRPLNGVKLRRYYDMPAHSDVLEIDAPDLALVRKSEHADWFGGGYQEVPTLDAVVRNWRR